MPDYIKFSVDLDGAGLELARLAKGPVTAVPMFEAALLDGYVTSEARVHVITGQLKASGHPSSEFDGTTWTGTISFARYPGIYELARGDSPTLNHPEGGHYFFDPGGREFERAVRQETWEWVTGEDSPAPSGDLPPESGGF